VNIAESDGGLGGEAREREIAVTINRHISENFRQIVTASAFPTLGPPRRGASWRCASFPRALERAIAAEYGVTKIEPLLGPRRAASLLPTESRSMRALLTLIAIIYLAGIGVDLSPKIQAME
jgi:hypothetical protein